MGVRLSRNPQENTCSQSLTSCGTQQCYHLEGPSVLLCCMKNEDVNVGAQVPGNHAPDPQYLTHLLLSS